MARFHFLFSFLLTAVALISAATAEAARKDDAVMAVTLLTAERGTMMTTLETHGKAVPREDVSVSTDIAGVSVIEVCAEEGEYVEKGQVLARLDMEGLQFTLDALEADLAKAEREFERAKELRKTHATSLEVFGQREAAYLMLQAQVADARRRLKKAVVVAPTAGMIYQRDATVGAITQVDQPLFRIAARGEVELEVNIPEASAHGITPDTPVEAGLAGDDGKRPARIRIISPRIDPSTRTANVRLVFPAASFIPVNTFCSARFTLSAGSGLIVAATAIQQDTHGSYVWSVGEDGAVTRRAVTVLVRNGKDALIEGVEDGLSLVARAGAFLQEGDRVKPVESPQQQKQDEASSK